jgi:hypothetical protein
MNGRSACHEWSFIPGEYSDGSDERLLRSSIPTVISPKLFEKRGGRP